MTPSFGPRSFPPTRLAAVASPPSPATWPPPRVADEIAALISPEPDIAYPLEVQHRIRQDEPGDYLRTARDLARCVDVVSIQHEYGIWGGEDGEWVLDFVRALGRPAVATLHTVLRDPTDRQRAILSELVDRVEATVVMSRSAADLLATSYGVDRRRVEIIPHGVPDLPLVASSTVKDGLGLIGPPGHPQLRPAGAGQGLRARDRCAARGHPGPPGRPVRHRRGDPPGPPPSRGRGLPDRAAWRGPEPAASPITSGSSIGSSGAWS